MDTQKLIELLKEFLDQYNELKEANELRQIFSLTQSPTRDQFWFNSALSFIASIKKDYPTFNYYLGKYWNGKNEKVDFQTMNDYLLIAGLCVVNELFIETHKR